ncbi:DinB family protein [Aneurinibacillus soli]|uniref:DinB superfamily protein n=1 Tax=Aneurinibacillus soli TaxID=1500254 RepID=A0A0U5C8R2_9BACL|nr:DinB family protein [Aneurinibacillus soli]PYE62073.1 DinB family protein [Aneurinibacillus soli]BAU28739.1 DinB superfamily protein [Aneurinibacillus soli]
MNTKESLRQFEEISTTYLQELDHFGLEQLTRKPAESEWSLGQMYMHLINSALYMQLRNVEACRNQIGQHVSTVEEKTENGEAIFAQGSFPPIRIQVPSSKEYTPLQPESKEQIGTGLKRVLDQMRELEPTLDAIPLAYTARHPRLGALHAKEWYMLVEMHYRHHLRQKERIETWLMEGRQEK